MGKTFTISIVTPSYNQGEYIEETIKSVISQEGNFFIDYVIMDGGSSDNSVEIIKKYDALLKGDNWPTKCKGITYRWASERDKGQVDAIKKGFAIASGDIAGWLNSDDVYHDSKVFARVMGEFARDDSLMMLTGDGPFIDKEGREFGLHYVERLNLTELIYLDYHILQPATFLKLGIYKEEGLDESYNYCFDAEFFIRLIDKGYKYKKLTDNLACFRFYPETKTLSGLGKRYKESLHIARVYGNNWFYFIISALYKYFEIVMQNKYTDSQTVKRFVHFLRMRAYRLILGPSHRYV